MHADDSSKLYEVPLTYETQTCQARCSQTTSKYLDFQLRVDDIYVLPVLGSSRFYCRDPVVLSSIDRRLVYQETPVPVYLQI